MFYVGEARIAVDLLLWKEEVMLQLTNEKGEMDEALWSLLDEVSFFSSCVVMVPSVDENNRR